MNMINVKKDAEIVIDGYTAEVERVDNSVHGIIIKDKNCAVVLAVRKADYSINVLVPAPPKLIKKFRLAGALKGIKYEEFFDDKYSADMRATELEEFESKGEVTEVQVPE